MSALSELISRLPKCRHVHEPASRFAFTVNNPSRDERKQLLRQLKQWALYAVFQKEISKSGTPHLQGYVEFRRDLDECLARQVLETPRMYLKPAYANRESNKRYCTKTEDRIRGPWTVNNSKTHRRRVHDARVAAGKRSGEVRAQRSYAAQKAWRKRHNKMVRERLADGRCIHCGSDPWNESSDSE